MIWMLVGLSVFFFIASFFQLYYLHTRINTGPKLELKNNIEPFLGTVAKDEQKYQLEVLQWKMLAMLEEHTLKQRYHQANVLLMARIWTKYLCFVTGMILCFVGASFILGRIEEPETILDGKNQMVNFSLKTSSPGLVLATLGTVLMMTSVLVHNEIKVTDGTAYLHLKYSASFGDSTSSPEELIFGNYTAMKEEYDAIFAWRDKCVS